jgi:hypothetical protein
VVFRVASCQDGDVETSITIITTEANDPDQFEDMPLEERRERSAGWKKLPLHSGKYLERFFMLATDSDFQLFASGERPVDAAGETVTTRVIMKSSIPEVLPGLIALVEQKPDATAELLKKHGGDTADLGRVHDGLATGTWPESGDPAEEAAAFAFHLLQFARIAEESRKGICFEYRGQVTA